MAIWVNQDSRVLVQGLTGKQATLHTKIALSYGTKVVAGVVPFKEGQTHLGLPIYNTVAKAIEMTQANVSLIFVPAPFCKDALIEAIDAEIPLIVCITEGIPVLDMLIVKHYLEQHPKTRLIGPNCPGIMTPGETRVGIMPCDIHQPGCVGIVSRSGTLTYEAVLQTTQLGLGQSTCVGIGGDPLIGSNFIEVLSAFETDPQTKVILMVGEIGGCMEEEAAVFIQHHIQKPVVAYIAGLTAPPGKRMGHAGAMMTANGGNAHEKIRWLESSGVMVAHSLVEIGEKIQRALF